METEKKPATDQSLKHAEKPTPSKQPVKSANVYKFTQNYPTERKDYDTTRDPAQSQNEKNDKAA